MKPTFSFYKPADFGRVYQFLRRSEANDALAYERVRFQFGYGLHPDFIDPGLYGGFERTCGIWEDESGIISLAMTEGGSRFEETFFIFRSERVKTQELLGRMCDFAERFTSRVTDDESKNQYRLCVSEEDAVLAGFVSQRGYVKTEHKHRVMIKEYANEPEAVVLPEGFTIKDARTAEPFFTALAHNHSFRYNQDNDGGEKGFAKIRTMPDYRPELDLVLFDGEGQPAGLANFWVSEKSKTAYLEPMGTVWWYRKMGLGKALITEGINRTRAYGCTRLIGGDQPFYWNLGFEVKKEHSYWSWSSE
ncbi:MAG: GNAT family N-acetyltransferase [Oscillospiraceae bacterium]|nr:GNAT family N-acetyltransferase [Oscillospiraceae bacterium]